MNQSPNKGAGTPINEPQDANFQTPPASPTRQECPGAPSRNNRKRSRLDFAAIDDDNDDSYEPIRREQDTDTGPLLNSDPISEVSADPAQEGYPAEQLIDTQRKAVAEALTQATDQPPLRSTYLVSYPELMRRVAEAFDKRADEGANPCAQEVYQPWKPCV